MRSDASIFYFMTSVSRGVWAWASRERVWVLFWQEFGGFLGGWGLGVGGDYLIQSVHGFAFGGGREEGGMRGRLFSMMAAGCWLLASMVESRGLRSGI